MTNKLEEKRAQWQQHIQNWKSSDLSQKAYCDANNLKQNQFWYWSKKINEQASSTKGKPCKMFIESETAFVPVQIPTDRAEPSLSVELPNGIRLHGVANTPASTLQHVVAALS